MKLTSQQAIERPYPIVVDWKIYNIDLLLYHLKPRCFCVVELKARELELKDVGKPDFYLSAEDLANELQGEE